MSADNNNRAPASVEDFQDRLMDSALAELAGGRVPPDLSSHIFAAHDATLNAPATPTVARANRRILIRRVSTALAATLLFVMTMAALILPTFNPDRPIAHETKITRMVDEFNRLQTEKRYAESELLARRINALAPDDPLAQQVWSKSQVMRRELLNQGRSSNKQSVTRNVPETVEQLAIAPTGDGAELAYDQKSWKAFVKNRKGSKELGSDDKVSRAEISSPATPSPTPVQQAPAAEAYFESLPQSGNEYSKSQSGRGAADAKKLSVGIDASGRYGMPSQPPAPAVADGLDAYNDTQKPAVESYGFPPASPHPGDPNGIASPAITPEQQLGPVNNRRLDRYGSPDLKKQAWLKRETPRILLSDDEVLGRTDFTTGDKYTPINENTFIKAIGPDAVSTFSIDVDTASYANVRQFLMETHQLPPANAVRIEELVNYFQYDYTPPKNDDEAPFAAHVEVAGCPWNSEHRLARIAVKGREMERTKRPLSNLVFLVDVSGSMNEPAKLPLVVYGLEQLTKELGENDHIAIVVYAGTEGLALPSTSGSKQDMILATLGKLQAGGSTAGGAGINLAYQIAEDNFIKGGTNRVILCTDGDFNVGVTDTGELQKLVEKKAKDTGVFLSVLGFGRGNLNDAMMEAVSNHGNGNYHYVDNRSEARRVLVEEMTGTLVTIAKDVKIQVEFNPSQVAAYRLIGYEDRMLRTEDFNNDKKDAGEIGAGHNVTALYEVVPAGKEVGTPAVDPLKYQKPATTESAKDSVVAKDDAQSSPMNKELLTLKMRYKAPDGDTSKKLEWAISDAGKSYGEATDDFQFASAVAGFGLLLRDSQYKGGLTYAAVLELAQSGLGTDERGYRKEFLALVKEAKKLKHE